MAPPLEVVTRGLASLAPDLRRELAQFAADGTMPADRRRIAEAVGTIAMLALSRRGGVDLAAAFARVRAWIEFEAASTGPASLADWLAQLLSQGAAA